MSARRLKVTLLLAGVALAGAAFLAWTQPWFSIVIDEGPVLTVAGDVAAGAVSALALTTLVLIAALSIAGVVFRVILGVLEAALGVLIVLSGALALADPIGASADQITAATGVSGDSSLAALVASVSVTAWPVVATVAGALLAVVGVAVVATAARWPGSGRKYSAVRLESTDGSTIDDWDALSRGDDPT